MLSGRHTDPRQELLTGAKMALWTEWHYNASLQWHILDHPTRADVQLLVRDLDHLSEIIPVCTPVNATPRLQVGLL
ncbi:MAG: hypothetical protein VX733_05410 [Candidatus Latescibacterota bacterium]|nr:hypothetical protein [Candidatus Latescibacterota bacterium]